MIELLLVVAIIGILSSLIISAVINAAADSRSVMARQQQVVLQEALNAWIASAAGGTNGIAVARSTYTAASDKLSLIQNYLHSSTYSNLASGSSNGQYQNESMRRAGIYLTFSAWPATNYPVIEWND